MRSIRRSLTLYFLGLLGLGFLAVGVVVDRLMSRTLVGKELAAAESTDLRAEELIKDEREKFDQELLGQAQLIGQMMQYQYFTRFSEENRRFVLALHMLSLGVGTEGEWPLVVWNAGLSPSRRTWAGPVSVALARVYYTNLQLDELFLRQSEEDEEQQQKQYLQINATMNTIWRSPGMETFNFPFNMRDFDTQHTTVDWAFDDMTLPNGTEVRRVILRSRLPMGWVRMGGRGGPPRGPDGPENRERESGRDGRGGGRGPGGPGGPGPGGPGGGPPRNSGAAIPPQRGPVADRDPLPRVYIHYARPIDSLERKIQSVSSEAEQTKAALSAETVQELSRLRLWMAIVGGVCFLSIIVGGPLLIARGLVPLKTLSRGVSQVSERDFRLPVEQSQMSRELLPIHSRLSETLAMLRRAFDREKQSVADISHELRTPVAALMTTLDVTLRKPRTAEEYHNALLESREISRQLSRLVQRVMTLARIDAGTDPISPVPTDLHTVAVGCNAVIRPLAEDKHLTYQAKFPDSLPIVTDPDKLREVLINLLHNAIEYNKPDGSINLTIRSADGGGAILEVADTGIGMSPDVRERIFERFFRADSARHQTGTHAGLGLSIVKEYIDRLNGEITVVSELGVGSRFVIKLPARPPGYVEQPDDHAHRDRPDTPLFTRSEKRTLAT